MNESLRQFIEDLASAPLRKGLEARIYYEYNWRSILPTCQQKHIDAIDQVTELIRDCNRNRKK
ncbi:hypothetical protein [Proteiniphilum sp. UBA5480]|uniref:hypothetical protein n=1 Tax=Proteiniphilum sp. UBA5480 TaxID=1947282 RepID=UPI000E938198|nr:hypothetical protein [Proteiniphilum sp. UBA5480]HBG56406.1 hypothetical protein [Porphyromonadaceae bacterium]